VLPFDVDAGEHRHPATKNRLIQALQIKLRLKNVTSWKPFRREHPVRD
jgi:hypothetical protein